MCSDIKNNSSQKGKDSAKLVVLFNILSVGLDQTLAVVGSLTLILVFVGIPFL